MTKEIEENHVSVVDETTELHDLLIYNDDVNSFDHVINSLIEICKHEYEQAGQCALIIHTNGKCGVKRGDYYTLKPMCEALLDRKLSAVIE